MKILQKLVLTTARNHYKLNLRKNRLNQMKNIMMKVILKIMKLMMNFLLIWGNDRGKTSEMWDLIEPITLFYQVLYRNYPATLRYIVVRIFNFFNQDHFRSNCQIKPLWIDFNFTFFIIRIINPIT